MARLDKTATIIFGNQLYKDHAGLTKYRHSKFLMIEADNIFRKRKYHKHKIMLIILAMRRYRNYLKTKNINIEYIEYKRGSDFFDCLKRFVKSNEISKLVWMQNSNKQPNISLMHFCSKHGLEYEVLENQQFLTGREELQSYFTNTKNNKMDNFYKWQRKRMSILIDGGKPEGGKWSYDYLNRKPLPKNINIPQIPKILDDKLRREVAKIVEDNFSTNPGSTENFWVPTNHLEVEDWFKDFINNRLENFGPYEDAMRIEEPFLYHSALSPLLNIGLLTPKLVVDKVMSSYQKGKITLNTCEGFIRQVIGWREYVYGMYQYNEEKIVLNFFGFEKNLESWWYDSPQKDLPMPLSEVLKTTFELGYNHHIERLMVLGNWFLLNEYSPYSVYEWFSSMYVDAYDWVMIPNVYGMSQYSDGGFLATKPYISGGNYLQKMGGWWPNVKEAQSSEFTILYWKFIKKHSLKFANNPRMSLILSQAKKRI